MQDLPPNNEIGIPVVVCGIPTVQDQNGILSPFPYLNSEHPIWGEDDQDDGDGGGSIGVRPRFDDEPDLGGDEVEEDEYDDEDDDDMDSGFGLGLMIKGIFAPPSQLRPA